MGLGFWDLEEIGKWVTTALDKGIWVPWVAVNGQGHQPCSRQGLDRSRQSTLYPPPPQNCS